MDERTETAAWARGLMVGTFIGCTVTGCILLWGLAYLGHLR